MPFSPSPQPVVVEGSTEAVVVIITDIALSRGIDKNQIGKSRLRANSHHPKMQKPAILAVDLHAITKMTLNAPLPGKECLACGFVGHFSNICQQKNRQKSNTNAVNTESADATVDDNIDDEYIYSIRDRISAL
jgi:hypothetical protein